MIIVFLFATASIAGVRPTLVYDEKIVSSLLGKNCSTGVDRAMLRSLVTKL